MAYGRSNSKTHQTGSFAEDLALSFLTEQGLMLVAQNWHVARVGEIDLIMTENKTLVFVEVRYRKNSHYGGAAASVSASKQQKIIQTAQYFLSENEEFAEFDCRFDVIAIESIVAIENNHITSSPLTNNLLSTNQAQNLKNYDIDWIQSAFLAH